MPTRTQQQPTTEVPSNGRQRRRQGLRPRGRARASPGELDQRTSGPERRARGLGWFSLALGLVEVAAPGALARGIGLRRGALQTLTLAGLGLRELAAGIGLLATERPAGWMWARVAGDALDLGLLGVALASARTDHQRAGAATAAVAGVTALDVWTALDLGGDLRERLGYLHVTRTVTVNRPPDEVYRFWRDLENLPRFMAHLASVRVLDDRRSRWSATAPAGTTVEWEAELIDDRPNELVAWRSIGGLENSGTVRFAPAPGSRGTEVCVEMTYAPPGGVLGATVAKLFGEEPAGQIEGDLRRFKQVMEVGEVVHSDSSVHRGMHPARPSAR